MGRPRTRRSPAAALAAVLLLVGGTACTGGTEDPGPGAADRTAPASDGASTPPVPTSTATATPPAGGTSADPVPVEPRPDLLAWQPVPGPVTDTVTVSGPWTLTVDDQGRRAVLDGPRPATVAAGPQGRISDALMDGRYALVVSQHRLEERPSTATVLDLDSGRRLVLDGDSPVATTTGGTWALGQGRVLHATTQGSGADARYCLAAVDLPGGTSTVAWCAPPRHGFNQARTTAEGDTLLAFDDAQPSCRTVGSVTDGALTAFPGVADCEGWDGALLAGGRIWSVIPNERRIDAARFYAAVGDAYVDLGPGTSGSLVACGGAAYFTRDPGRAGEPARVLRWTPDGELSTVYEAPVRGEGFVVVPLRCGADTLTLTTLSESGDEQVSAPLG